MQLIIKRKRKLYPQKQYAILNLDKGKGTRLGQDGSYAIEDILLRLKQRKEGKENLDKALVRQILQ